MPARRCSKGKCCAGAIIAVPVLLILSPIIVPTVLVRRALGYKCKCRGKCANNDKDANQEQEKEQTAKDTEEAKEDRA